MYFRNSIVSVLQEVALAVEDLRGEGVMVELPVEVELKFPERVTGGDPPSGAFRFVVGDVLKTAAETPDEAG